jgi:tripartite-type tricarboxylate transporter receptor subunit TctC
LWNHHPEPSGSRRATPLLLFQHRAGQFPISETLPGFDFIGWFAVVAPTGTPADVIERMNREMDAALKDAEIARRMREVGMYSDGAGIPEQTAAFLRAQSNAWGKIIQDIGLQPE